MGYINFTQIDDDEESDYIIRKAGKMLDDVFDDIEDVEDMDFGGDNGTKLNKLRDIVLAMLERQKATFLMYNEANEEG